MSGKLKQDLTGMRFGMLMVIGRAESDAVGRPKWKCVCDCGEVCVKYGSALTSGITKSCGCYRKYLPTVTKRKHGNRDDRLYAVWNMMKQRCHNPNNRAYKWYGARGIVVCDEWRNSYASFRNWAYSNGYDELAQTHVCTIDRINNDGNYTPSNCRFADAKTQAQNRRRANG